MNMIKHTAHGSKYRVQFRVIDLTGEDVPVSARRARPMFSVYVLDASYDKATAFTAAGKQVYCGDDPDTAYDTAKQYVSALSFKLPKAFLQYLVRWKKEEVSSG